MTPDDGPRLPDRLGRVIDSVLADLAAERDRWSRPDLITSTAAELVNLSYRLAEDTQDLAETPVSEIRGQLIDILGGEAYAALLANSPSERADIAEFVVIREAGDGCALEDYGGAQFFDLDIAMPLDDGTGYGRLPLPFPYLVAWGVQRLAGPQAEHLVRAVHADLQERGPEWRAVVAAEPAGMLISLRESGLGLLARPGGPAALREELVEILGDRISTQLLDPGDMIEKLVRLNSESSPDRWWQGSQSYFEPDLRSWPECLPRPLPDWPKLIVSMASSVAHEFGPDETLVVLRASVADVVADRESWQQLAVARDGGLFWATRLVADRLAATSPARLRAQLEGELDERCYRRLTNATDHRFRPLAATLTEKVQQGMWWNPDDDTTDPDVVSELRRPGSPVVRWGAVVRDPAQPDASGCGLCSSPPPLPLRALHPPER